MYCQVVSEPCDASSALDVSFDASYSKDPSGRQLVSYTWSQSGSMNPTLQGLIDEANNANAKHGATKLAISASGIQLLPNGDYTLVVAVMTFLGQTGVASVPFTKKGPGEAPSVSIVGGQQQDFKLSEGIRVSSQLLAKSVCAGKEVGHNRHTRIVRSPRQTSMSVCLIFRVW